MSVLVLENVGFCPFFLSRTLTLDKNAKPLAFYQKSKHIIKILENS